MRCLLAVTLLAACGRPAPFPVKPLPELVSAAQPTMPLAITGLQLVPGESLIWSVHWKGITVGRAELAVTERDVRSRFTTDALVSTVVSIQYDLETVLDRTAARAASATEKLVIDGDTKQVAETFDGVSYAVDGRSVALPGGNPGQTLHSALGALRAWAGPDARPGYLVVVHAGQPYRLDVSRPVTEELQGTGTLRVACRVIPQDKQLEPFAVTVWLTADPQRTPVRIEITSAEAHITAELINTAAA
jgi:Protein of unknown function (DUF3108)